MLVVETIARIRGGHFVARRSRFSRARRADRRREGAACASRSLWTEAGTFVVFRHILAQCAISRTSRLMRHPAVRSRMKSVWYNDTQWKVERDSRD